MLRSGQFSALDRLGLVSKIQIETFSTFPTKTVAPGSEQVSTVALISTLSGGVALTL